MFKYFRPSWLEIKCCLREKSLTPTRFLVLLDFWDCRVRPFKANSWEGCCKRVTEHISMLICAVSTIMMIRKRNLLEGAPCPFYPHSQHSSTPVTSHHHMPIFCSFHPLSSWKNLCYNYSFFPSSPPCQTVLRLVPAVGQSVHLHCLWPSSSRVVWWLLWCKIWTAYFLKDVLIKILCRVCVWWPSQMGHTPSMCFLYAVASSREATKNRMWWFGLQGNG